MIAPFMKYVYVKLIITGQRSRCLWALPQGTVVMIACCVGRHAGSGKDLTWWNLWTVVTPALRQSLFMHYFWKRNRVINSQRSIFCHLFHERDGPYLCWQNTLCIQFSGVTVTACTQRSTWKQATELLTHNTNTSINSSASYLSKAISTALLLSVFEDVL